MAAATEARGRPARDAYTGVRVLVLGASGFIGRRVVAALRTRQAAVVAACRSASPSPWPGDRGVSAVACDVTDGAAVHALLESVRPAVTFNLAGYGVDRTERDDALAEQINAVLPGRLAEGLSAAELPDWPGTRLVHVGSALEYGEAGGDLREETPPIATTLYGRTKLAGTLAVRARAAECALPGLTARLFTVYGPGEHDGRLLPALLETARTGQPLQLTAGLQRRDFTFVDDVADGLLRLGVAAARPGEIVNLATGELTTVRAFVERSAGVLGIEPALLRFGALPTRGEEMAHEPVAIHRLRTLTGWAPSTTIEEGVRRTRAELNGIETNV